MSEAGVLVVDKTAGVTSFDAVALVRRRLGLKRVGHAGTLDPDATGVLPMLLGEATKLMAYLAEQDKEYVATLRLGLTTDTGDLSGRVLAEAPVGDVDRARVEEACRPFLGRIKQVPPMFSAVHHGGRRLYELAREGLEVVREPREVVIHAIDVQEVSVPQIRLRVVCGKGTYLRTLAADLGAALGCGAAVERLARTRVGRDINRHYYSAAQLQEALTRSVVRSQLALLRLRNTHAAFHGSFHVSTPAVDVMEMTWKNGAEFARLDVNLTEMHAVVTCSQEGAGPEGVTEWRSPLEAKV